MSTFTKLAIMLAVVGMVALAPAVSLAITIPDTPVPSGVDPSQDVETTINTVLDNVSKILVIVAIGIAVIAIIWGAILYMTAGGSPENAEKARSVIINGIIGAVIIFALSFIVGFVIDLTGTVLKR